MGGTKANFSVYFAPIWDRIIQYIRYEDDIEGFAMWKLLFRAQSATDKMEWEQLAQPLSKQGALSMRTVKMPELFRHRDPFGANLQDLLLRTRP